MHRLLTRAILAVATITLIQGCGGGSGTPLPGSTTRSATITFTAVTSAGVGFIPKGATIERFWLPQGVTAESTNQTLRTVDFFDNYSGGLNKVSLIKLDTNGLPTAPLDNVAISFDSAIIDPASLETRIRGANPSPSVILDDLQNGTSIRSTVPLSFTVTVTP